jgi:hypothetical protein
MFAAYFVSIKPPQAGGLLVSHKRAPARLVSSLSKADAAMRRKR